MLLKLECPRIPRRVSSTSRPAAFQSLWTSRPEGLRICVSDELPGGADVAGLKIPIWELLVLSSGGKGCDEASEALSPLGASGGLCPRPFPRLLVCCQSGRLGICSVPELTCSCQKPLGDPGFGRNMVMQAGIMSSAGWARGRGGPLTSREAGYFQLSGLLSGRPWGFLSVLPPG